MYVRNDASKMVIQYSSRKEAEMSSTSLPAGRGYRTSLPNGQAGDMIVIEYWVTGKEADNHLIY